MAGLCHFEIGIYYIEDGKIFLGPYGLNYAIKLTSKAVKWFSFDEKFGLLPKPQWQHIHEYVFVKDNKTEIV